MRIGSPARSFARLVACVTIVTVMTAAPQGARGQAPPGKYRMVNPQETGGQIIGPVDPYGGVPIPPGYGAPGPRPGFTGPMPMGDGGTCPPVGYDLMNDVGTEGYLIDQRGPHYFDLRVEAVYLERDETFEEDIDISQEGLGGPIVLSTGELEYDGEPGFRILGRYDIGPLSVIEFGYMGIYSYEDSATYVDPNNPDLFSLFSNFGTFPATVSNVGGPMPQTERAQEHSISIESDLQTAEIMYRRYWLGHIPRVSGTIFGGFRYTKVNEEFEFFSLGSETVPVNTVGGELASMDYDVEADNDLSGFQGGADLWVGLMQGLRFGAEGKAGLYANHYSVTNKYTVTPPPNPQDPLTPPLFLDAEEFDEDQPALIAEASVDLVADILPSVSLRVGYEVLFINQLVLASENFNPGSPYNIPGDPNPRVPFVEDDSDLFYHGGHAGIEFIW
jgi:hypothetical protein